MAAAPLIRKYAPGAVFAYRGGRAITVEEYLRDVRQLAGLLPDGRYMLNLCADRYRFSVAFAAALLRRQVNLLPPNQAPHTMEQIGRHHPGTYALVDRAAAGPPIETYRYPALSGNGAGAPVVPAVPAGQIAAIAFSSGSTGQPLPHEHSWGALAAGAVAGSHGARFPGAVVVGTVPPQHMYGLESTVLMAMQNGLALHAGRPFYPADICAELEAVPRPRALVTTPVHLRALLADAAGAPRVEFLLCATAPLSPQLAAAAEARFSAPLYEIYGCTEAGQVAMRRTVETPEWRTLPGVALRQDAQGTWVEGGHVETEVLLSDVIEQRGRDQFLLHGRIADLVNIAGKRTSLAHLNYHLNSIEGVRDGAFVMPEDGGSGTVTRLIAFVVAPDLSRDALLKALRQRIDDAFMPRPLSFVEALPRNDTGKLPRQALAELMSRARSGAG